MKPVERYALHIFEGEDKCLASFDVVASPDRFLDVAAAVENCLRPGLHVKHSLEGEGPE